MKTVVDDAGRIQLPENVQEQLGVKPGDEIILEQRAGQWVLLPADADLGLGWEGSVLVHRGTTMTSATIQELLEEERAERFRQLTEGIAP